MKKKGFTLIEMLAVIAVLGILVLLVLPNVLKSYRNAKKMAFLDEAKTVYTKATDDFIIKKTQGKRINYISNDEEGIVENELNIQNEKDLVYTVTLNNKGEVTSFLLKNSEFCIIGIGDFLNNYTIEQIIDLTDKGDGVDSDAIAKCNFEGFQDNTELYLDLVNRIDDNNVGAKEANPNKLTLRYRKGWYDRETKSSLGSDVEGYRIIDVPTKPNYYYKGSYTDTTEVVNCNGTIMVDKYGLANDGPYFTQGVLNKKAVSTFEKKYYVVSFDLGGGSANISNVICQYGDVCTVHQVTPTRVGYDFTGWKFGNQGYQPGDFITEEPITDQNEDNYPSLKFNKNEVCQNGEVVDNPPRKFVAQWKLSTFTIALDKQGGSGGTDTIYEKYSIGWFADFESTQALTSIVRPTLSGYAFDGYYTQQNGGGTQIVDSDGKIISGKQSVYTSNGSLYANWKACGPGKYSYNNTCVACPKNTYSTGAANAQCTNCPTGYNTDGTGKTAKTACTINCSANMRVATADAQCTTACPTGYNHAAHTIIAGNTSTVCSANVFTVAYNGNSSTSGSVSNHNCTYDAACTLKSNGFRRNGYQFSGWKKSNSGTTLSAGASIKNVVTSGTVTYYAQWNYCAAGTYESGGTCVVCPAGYYCTGGTNKTACPKGTYRSSTGGKAQSDCTSCAACKTTASAASTSASACVWNQSTSTYNATAKGYQGKIGIVSNGSCITNVKAFWGTFRGYGYSGSAQSSGNYGFEDWFSENNHGYCSNNPFSTFGFERYILSSNRSMEFTSNYMDGGKSCKKAPLNGHILSEVNGVGLGSGTRNYTFSSSISGEKTIFFQIRNGGGASNITVSGIKFNVNGSYYTLQQMVNNGYIEPLVLYGAFAVYSDSVAINLYTGGSEGSGFYPDTFVLMTLKSGYTLRGFQAYQSSGSNTGAGDGYYMRVIDPNYMRVVLK